MTAAHACLSDGCAIIWAEQGSWLQQALAGRTSYARVYQIMPLSLFSTLVKLLLLPNAFLSMYHLHLRVVVRTAFWTDEFLTCKDISQFVMLRSSMPNIATLVASDFAFRLRYSE